MSRFRKVDAATWADRRFSALSNDAKLLWFYLLTGPYVTSLPGVLVVGQAALMEGIGWTKRRLEKAFFELENSENCAGLRSALQKNPQNFAKPMAIADWKSKIVWLPGSPKYNRPANPNVVAGWRDLWRCVPESELKGQIEAHLRAYAERWGVEFLRRFNEFAAPSPATLTPAQGGRGGTLQRETVSETVSETIPDTVPQTIGATVPRVRARARTAPAPVTAPSLSEGVQGEGDSDSADPSPPPRHAPLFSLGTAPCDEACWTFVSTLDEEGWPRAELRERWERQSLCDAVNVHLRADDTIQGALAELRRAVREWVAAYRDESQFTSGWSARKFSDWLAGGRKMPKGRKPEPVAESPASEPMPSAVEVHGPPVDPTPEQRAALENFLKPKPPPEWLTDDAESDSADGDPFALRPAGGAAS